MKKFNKLNQQLENLHLQKNTLSSIENISIFEFLKYKNLISKENKLSNQKAKILEQGKQINFWYDDTTQAWIENPKIKCRKYYHLEKKACYKKDKKLYKLGLIEAPPVPILFQKYTLFSSLLNHFKKITNKIQIFRSYVFPKFFNNLAIGSAKKIISGYRLLEKDIQFFRNCISNTNSLKYLKSVKSEAIRQLNYTGKQPSFREYIKVDTNNLGITVSSKKILPNNNYHCNVPKQLSINNNYSNKSNKDCELSL